MVPPCVSYSSHYKQRRPRKRRHQSPHTHAGGFGAKLESWAFALDLVGLQLLMRAGTFSIRTCKLCTDGVVVQGEYGITNVLFKNGYNIATLMHKYGKQVCGVIVRRCGCC